jgi:hypothetical protein
MLISRVFLTSHPGINVIKRIEKAALTFSISKITLEHIAYTYIFQHTTILPVQRTLKEFLPSLDQGKIATKSDQQDWHQQELWLHWQVNSDRFDIQSPSLICDPTIVNDPKRTPTIVSLSDFQGLPGKFLLIIYFAHIKSMMRYCFLPRLCTIFRFDWEDITVIRSRFFKKQSTPDWSSSAHLQWPLNPPKPWHPKKDGAPVTLKAGAPVIYSTHW